MLKGYTILYFFIIILALMGSVIQTLPTYKQSKKTSTNLTSLQNDTLLVFAQIEESCMIFFSIEFIVRLLICPSKIIFLLTPLNYIELLPILSFYISLFGSLFYNAKEILKMLLLFKFFRRSESLNMLIDTVIISFKEILIYIIYIIFGVLIFSR